MSSQLMDSNANIVPQTAFLPGNTAFHDQSRNNYPAGSRPYYEDEDDIDEKEFSIEALPSPWAIKGTVEWCVAGLLVENGITMISGESGIGKSMVVLALCCSLAHGEPFAGRETKKRPVLYLDRENPSVVIRDRLELLGGPETENLKYWGDWVDAGYWTNDPETDLIEDYVKEHHPILVIDSLIAFHSGNEQDASETRRHMRTYRHLTTLGATVILIHHSGKAESSKEYRGSSDIKAAVDVAFVVERNALDGAPATGITGLCLRPFKCRMAELEPIFLEFNGHGFEAGKNRKQANQAKLEDLIRKNPGKNQTELVKLGALAGLSKKHVTDLLKVGESSKVLKAEPGANNSKKYWVV